MKNNITADLLKSMCFNHTGKMTGMASVSTACTLNPYCIKRHENNDSVCGHCYAFRMLKAYKALREKAENNTRLWCDSLYSPEYMPRLNCEKFRLEAFGDISCTTQVLNYFALCRANKNTHFALWTKNPQVVWEALEMNGFRKPGNLVLVYSSPALNVPADNMRKLYIMPNGVPMIDKIFTVYTPEYIKEHGISINCGAKSCLTCGRCYTKRTGADVREKLK